MKTMLRLLLLRPRLRKVGRTLRRHQHTSWNRRYWLKRLPNLSLHRRRILHSGRLYYPHLQHRRLLRLRLLEHRLQQNRGAEDHLNLQSHRLRLGLPHLIRLRHLQRLPHRLCRLDQHHHRRLSK